MPTHRPAGLPAAWRRRPALFFALISVLAGGLALTERGLRGLLSDEQPAAGAAWIWAQDRGNGVRPVAFYAVRDFELDTPRPVWIEIAADEAYDLRVNGQQVGFESYRAGAAIARYPVGHLVLAGANRITVRLQSLRGAGGFLAVVEIAAGGDDGSTQATERTSRLVTGDGWRIYRSYHLNLFEAGTELEAGEPPRIWARAPTGRWRLLHAGEERPPTTPAVGERRPGRQPERARNFRPAGKWFDLRRPRKEPVRRKALLLDWGEDVRGRFAIRRDAACVEELMAESLAAESEAGGPEPLPSEPNALLYFGGGAPDPETRSADEIVTFAPGERIWRSATTHRFRYALVVGADCVRQVWVQPVHEALLDLLARPEIEPGVYGLPAPPSVSPIERRVWERLW